MKDPVIYGVYDNRQRPFWVRISDFFIDRQRISLKEKAYFFHLLGVSLDAGMTLLKALHVLADKNRNERLRRVLSTLVYEMENGKSFSEAMGRFPDVFSEAEIGLVKSGEATGDLYKMLLRLSDQLDQDHELTLRMRTALVYPLTVILVLVIAMTVVVLWVVPNLTQFFGELDADLPLATRAMLWASYFISDYWWVILIVFLVGLIFYNLYVRTEEGRFRWDLFKLRMPIFGRLYQKFVLARLVRLLGVLMGAGLPIRHVLQILGRSAQNDLYRRKLEEVLTHVEEGKGIAESLKGSDMLFPDMLVHVLEVGERSANLEKSAQKLALHYDHEIEHSLKEVTSILEPVAIVLVGLAVLFFALAILGPVFSLSELV